MKLEDKIYGSIGLTVFLTIAYYYAYSFVDLYVSKLCDKYVCFEFPPYADFLAIWAAIIGLYFVVTSLDSWKRQDLYQTAKKNIELLHEIAKLLEKYTIEVQELNQREIRLLITLQRLSQPTLEETQLLKKYNQMASDLEVKKYISEYEYKITMQNKNLYQDDFIKILSSANSYIYHVEEKLNEENRKVIKEYLNLKREEKKTTEKMEIGQVVRKLNETERTTLPDMSLSILDTSIRHGRIFHEKFKTDLTALQKKLNDFIN